MLAAVQNGTAYEPIGGLADPADDPNPGPANFDPADVTFGRPIFLDEQPADDADFTPSDDPVWFETEPTALCGFWDYSGMAPGVSYSAVWGLNGEIQESVSYIDEVWSGEESGSWWVCITNENGVPDGMWDLALSVEGNAHHRILRRRRRGPRAIRHRYQQRRAGDGLLPPDLAINLDLLGSGLAGVGPGRRARRRGDGLAAALHVRPAGARLQPGRGLQ